MTFVDTSILCELLAIPGKCTAGRDQEIRVDMDRRSRAGERLVIPVTALIETGNHIAQCVGDRYRLAGALVGIIRAAMSEDPPWLVLEAQLGRPFLDALCAGDSTGETFEQLAVRGVGAGDVALLVERDQFLNSTAFAAAQVWTLDGDLSVAAQVRQ